MAKVKRSGSVLKIWLNGNCAAGQLFKQHQIPDLENVAELGIEHCLQIPTISQQFGASEQSSSPRGKSGLEIRLIRAANANDLLESLAVFCASILRKGDGEVMFDDIFMDKSSQHLKYRRLVWLDIEVRRRSALGIRGYISRVTADHFNLAYPRPTKLQAAPTLSDTMASQLFVRSDTYYRGKTPIRVGPLAVLFRITGLFLKIHNDESSSSWISHLGDSNHPK